MAKTKTTRPEPPRHATLLIIDPAYIGRFNRQLEKAGANARLRYSSKGCGGDQGFVWAEATGPALSLADCTTLRKALADRVNRLKAHIGQAAGDLYPAIWAGEIEVIESLFLKLTGHPLNDPSDNPTPAPK
jgi:hypothetical protein